MNPQPINKEKIKRLEFSTPIPAGCTQMVPRLSFLGRDRTSPYSARLAAERSAPTGESEKACQGGEVQWEVSGASLVA